MIQIAPSILAADLARLGDEIRAVEAAGADAIHIDVMDGHFVPNLTIGVPVVASIRKITKLPLDVHLMITNPEQYLEPFATAGADWLSIHAETCDLRHALPAIKKLSCKAGAVINPPTAVEQLLPCLHLADYCVVMTVNPGFSGQTMIADCIDKIRQLKRLSEERGLYVPIEVDGGVTTENAGQCLAAGATILVAGNAVFRSSDYRATIAALRGETAHS